MGLEKMMAERASGATPDGQFVDLRYADLMRDPLAAVRAVYDRLDMTLPDDIADLMRAYLAAKPRGKHGEHRYRLEDFGLDRERLRRGYAAYCARFDVPAEED